MVQARTDRPGWRARPGWLVVFAMGFCAAIYLYPLLKLVAWAFRDEAGHASLANALRLAGDKAYHDAFVNTFEIAGVSTLACLLLGYPLAYLMATTGPRARAVLAAAVLIPFWTSVLARSLAWLILLGRQGVVNQWLVGLGLVDQPVRMLFNAIGVQIGMVHVLLPFMVLPIYAVLARIDPGLPLAARSLGASPARALLYVVLPLSLPGVIAGASLVFILAVGFYITPALLGGPGEITVAALIEMMVRDLLDWGFGAMLSLTLLAMVGGVFGIGVALAGLERLMGTERAR
jgi:putative spermidine/putrescine transport system permease protein